MYLNIRQVSVAIASELEEQFILRLILSIRRYNTNQYFHRVLVEVLYNRIGHCLERIRLDIFHFRQCHFSHRRIERHYNDVVKRIRSELEAVIRELLTCLIIKDDIIQGSDIRFHAFECDRVRIIRLILSPYINDNSVTELVLFGHLVVIPGNSRYVRDRQSIVQFHLIVVTLRVEVLQRHLIDVNHLQGSIRREFNRIVNRVGARSVVLRTYGKHVFVTQRLALV